MLVKSPGFTVVALVVLALGIGANTAIFSVVDAVLLRPLSYAEPDRLMIMWEKATQMDTSVSYPNFVDWERQQTSFESLGASRRESFNLTGAGDAERLQGRMVSNGFFSTFGVPLARGRDFTPEDDRPEASPVIILSYGLWQRRFGAEESIVGSQLTLNNRSFTVIGVSGERFNYGSGADLFAPLGLWADRYKERGSHPGIYVVGKVKPGVTLEQARTDMDGIMAALGEQYPKTNAERRIHIESLFENTVQDVRSTLYVLLAAVGFVLLIACANVANLLLARAAVRHREIALRTALGAGRGRIIRQLLTESIVLSLVGGALGLLLAVWGTDALVASIPGGVPRADDVGVDLRVLGFTLVVAVLTGVFFGLVPALASSRPNLNDALKEGERGSTGHRHKVRNVLVVSEVALALVLLVGAGLMIRSVWSLQQVRLGFDPENLLTMQISLQGGPEDAQKTLSFTDQLERQLATVPGVTSAALTCGLPFAGAPENSIYVARDQIGQPNSSKMAVMYVTTPNYRETMGLRLLRGRYFTDQDRAGAPPVAVVDESLVEKYFGGEDPIGKHLYDGDEENAIEIEIVGVVGHVKHYGIDGDVPVDPQYYVPLAQVPAQAMPFVTRNLGLLLRTSADMEGVAAAARNQVRSLDPNQPVFSIRTMDEIVSQSLSDRQFTMVLLAVFAGVALLLAAAGIYGIMSYSVTQRTHEVGIRMALGADRKDVLGMIVRQGMVLAGIGVVVGLAKALILMQLMKSLLFGVSATDPATFVCVAALLVGVAFFACVIPARRATKVDPIVALRYE
jgi:putative ABC transport system permease protein